MNGWDIVIILALAAAVCAAAKQMHKAKGAGCTGCCAGCTRACASKGKEERA